MCTDHPRWPDTPIGQPRPVCLRDEKAKELPIHAACAADEVSNSAYDKWLERFRSRCIIDAASCDRRRHEMYELWRAIDVS